MRTGSSKARQAGFTYLGLIIFVTVLGLVGAATLKIDALLRRAAAEEELLTVGAAFADALTSYAAATRQGQPTQPPSLNELLRDPRSPAVRRHLRKIYIDPMTGTTDWGIVWLADGKGVLGVYSKSQAAPLKIANFDPKLVGFEGKLHVSEWRFVATGPAPIVPVAAPAPAAQPSLFPPAAPVGEAPKAEVPKIEEPKVEEPKIVEPEPEEQPQQEVATPRPQRRE
ncbi:MAG: type II secretion system protein [Massilia sp.]